MALGPLRFTNAAGGTVDFTYPGPAIDMQSPASAGAVNGTLYEYYAQSLDMAQWEIGVGAYNSGTGVFSRTTISANSLGTTAKISFTNPPEIAFYEIAGTIPGGGTATPLMDGTAAAGTAAAWSHEDHVHPNDVTKVGVIKKQVFTASGTYTPSANLLYAIVELVGPGGGGGGVTTVDTARMLGGGGGGGGGYSRKILSAATIGASQAVTVGTGGAGGAAGSNSGSAGSGNTSVGTLCTAGPGGGGTFCAAAQYGNGGAGGSVGTGDFTSAGEQGWPGVFINSTSSAIFPSGRGGKSFFGNGAPGVSNSGGSAPGIAGGLYGGGGSGGVVGGVVATIGGGAGAAGVVFITEFCAA